MTLPIDNPLPPPAILSITKDALGRTVVVDTEGTTVLDPSPGAQASGTFAVNVDWGGGFAEIRWSSEDDQGNNRSLVHVGLYGAKSDGYTTWGTGHFLLRANGDGWSGWYTSVGRDWVHLAQRDVWTGHGADGGLGMEVGILQGEIYDTSCNNIWGTQWHNMTNYVVIPNPPFNISVRAGSVATTSFGVDFTRSSHDHVDQDEVQWALDSGFTQVVWTDNPGGGGNGSAGYSNPSGAGKQLTPGTLHYVRARSHTARGWGGYSPTVSQTTLPAVAPGLTVVASPSGTEATLTMTPPGGVSGVSYYSWERRIPPNLDWVRDENGPAVQTVTGLTPGQIYEWSATAFFGTYESPRTEWIAVQQPNPNVDPGDYFDGDTADKPGIDYVWTGTPGKSTSQAKGKNVVGWSDSTSTPADAIMHQADSGLFGTYAARVLIQRDEGAAAQVTAGTSSGAPNPTEVVPGALYFGSLHVSPSRAQRMRAQIRWYREDKSQISIIYGASALLPANEWTRMTVSGIAPSDAVMAVVRAVDVAGEGHSIWLSGESFLLDGAMLTLGELFPYFDGDSPDTSDWDYQWEGVEHESISSANPVSDPNYNPFEDPECPRPPRAPRPPVITDDCIEETGTWSRYWSVIPEDEVTEWLTMVPTILLKVGAVDARQIRVRLYPNPDNLPPEDFQGEWTSEQIVSYLPANSNMLIDGVDQRSWASVEGDPTRYAADHLLYGTGGGPATWPLLSCGRGYLASFDVPKETPTGNLEIEIALTQRRSA